MKQNFVAFLMCLMCLTLAGCASQKPSEPAVKKLVREHLHARVPTSWIDKRYAQARNPEISSIEIVKWGNFNKSEKYWALKIKVVGKAEVRTAFQVGYGSTGTIHSFDTIADFRFSKDDYGNWKISASPLNKEVMW